MLTPLFSYSSKKKKLFFKLAEDIKIKFIFFLRESDYDDISNFFLIVKWNNFIEI